MSLKSKRKGERGEREVCELLANRLGYNVDRLLGQARDGGGDIRLEGWVLEIKRRQSAPGAMDLKKWKEQSVASTAVDERSAVIFRHDRAPWEVLISAGDAFDQGFRPEWLSAGSIIRIKLDDFIQRLLEDARCTTTTTPPLN